MLRTQYSSCHTLTERERASEREREREREKEREREIYTEEAAAPAGEKFTKLLPMEREARTTERAR